MIEPTTSNSVAARASDSIRRASFGEKFDDFLKLLTTQLQNQDPTAPLDSDRFTQQLVQFSSVEQAIKTNQTLSQLLDMTRASQLLSAASYVGREVEFSGDSLFLPASGAAEIAYDLPRDAASVRARILDGEGNEVAVEEGLPVERGSHRYLWSGTGRDGRRLPSGTYRVEFEARDANGVTIDARLRSAGTVESVRFEGDRLMLSVGGTLRPASSVLAIRQVAG